MIRSLSHIFCIGGFHIKAVIYIESWYNRNLKRIKSCTGNVYFLLNSIEKKNLFLFHTAFIIIEVLVLYARRCTLRWRKVNEYRHKPKVENVVCRHKQHDLV